MVTTQVQDATQVAATHISFEEYLAKFAADFYEWVGGSTIKMTPSDIPT
jgi:hypothetical protein